MKTTRALALALFALGLMGSPAAAHHGGIHPTFATGNVYFHCNGDTKVYNANWLAQLGEEGAYVPWDQSPPSGSVTDGAGCGGADVGWVTNEVYDVVFAGTVTGNLRDMTIRLHEFVAGNLREASAQQMRIYAEVDGVPLFPVGNIEGGYQGRAFTVTPTVANSGVTHLYEFSVTNLGYAIDVFDEEGELVDVETGGLAREDGDGAVERYLKLMVGIDDFVGGNQPAGSTMWVWDTTEVPSGITFNPPSPAAATVEADLPG